MEELGFHSNWGWTAKAFYNEKMLTQTYSNTIAVWCKHCGAETAENIYMLAMRLHTSQPTTSTFQSLIINNELKLPEKHTQK